MAKYGEKAQETVESAMRRRKRGTLKSGRSGKKVTSREQAIAIGLSEAREKGAKVPAPPSSRSSKSGSSKSRSSKSRSSKSSSRTSGGRSSRSSTKSKRSSGSSRSKSGGSRKR
jgi:Family of unknown function (DUF6496)